MMQQPLTGLIKFVILAVLMQQPLTLRNGFQNSYQHYCCKTSCKTIVWGTVFDLCYQNNDFAVRELAN